MGTQLESVAAVLGSRQRRRRRRSGLRLADEAARICLDRAGRTPHDVDLLVNAGLYHDRLLGEPALAAIVQDDIEANPEDPHPGGHGTFSFDVANGACGMLTGLQVVDGFLRAGTVRRAVVVASDADPGHRLSSRFPYQPAGGAILCTWEEGHGGLADVRLATRPVDGGGLRGVVARQRRRNRLSIVEDEGFVREASALAVEVARESIDDRAVAGHDIDLLVANPLRPAFLDRVASGLGVPDDRVIRVPEAADTHTAGLGIALEAAQRSPSWARARTILLVSAGAGLVAGAALLRPAG
ncbi:MAG: 3-oxoacyl-[acyl-carrier-protein] synthase III C-terminal domain-containing protein [Acidimicrobiia bacterium]